MASKTEETNKKEELKFSDTKEFPDDIKEALKKELASCTKNIEPTKISKNVKAMLDKKYGEGWCVVAGGHFSGAFTYIENLYLEVTIGDIIVVLFKTYLPNKQ